MIKWSESLSLIVFPIPNNVHSLVAGKTIMERRCRDTELYWPIWHNLRLLPPSCFAPVDGEHMVGVDSAKLRSTAWFLLCNLPPGDLNILCLEGSTILNFLRKHLNLWLKLRCTLHCHSKSTILSHLFDGYS
jgi:hypothetical protein